MPPRLGIKAGEHVFASKKGSGERLGKIINKFKKNGKDFFLAKPAMEVGIIFAFSCLSFEMLGVFFWLLPLVVGLISASRAYILC